MTKTLSTQWIQTYTGRRVDPCNPRIDDINFLDVAHSLAHQVRYGGHFPKHYSIAEHCCRIHDMMECQYSDRWTCAEGLLHDATEAYLVDVPRPVKQAIPAYKVIEGRVWVAIAGAARKMAGVRLSAVGHPFSLRVLDSTILSYEVEAAWGTRAHKDWFELFGHTRPGAARDILTPTFWSPQRAKREYLRRLAKYGLWKPATLRERVREEWLR